jgi:tetratricopeptide (TPR) repeat protein
VEEILHQAEQLEKDYDWSSAAGLYEKARSLLPQNDFLRMGEISVRLGYAFYRAAFQAESNDEFRQTLRQAILTYEKTKELHGRLNESAKAPSMLRCDAMIAYMGYWLAPEASEKKRLLGDCWHFTEDSLRASKESGKAKEYGETYNQLSASALLGFCLEWDYQARKKIIKEVEEHGEMGIKLLSTVDEPDELAKAYAKTAFALSLFAFYFLDLDEKENCVRKAQSYWTKAKEASEASARLEMLYPVHCAHDLLLGFGSEEALANVQKALEHGRRTRDKFIIGSGLDWLTYHTAWILGQIDDCDELVKGERTVIQYAEDAKRQYSVISFISPRADAFWIETIHAQIMPGYRCETDLGKKRDMLARAIAAGRDALAPAEASGYPYAIGSVHHQLGGTLSMLAQIESNPEEKKKLLEEALQHGNEVSRIGEPCLSLSYWDLGVIRGALAAIKCELADLARDSETKKSMLQAAILERENAIKLLVKDMSFHSEKKTASFPGLGRAQYSAGGWWIRLCRLTRDKEHLKKAAEAFTEALESYQKVNLTSRIAECHWKIAQAYDELDDHLTAAKDFCLASDNFKGAAEKIPQLKSFYEDHALYMQAWGEIEKARHHHERQEYGLAKEHFEKAAELHKPLKRWSYLEPNYSAWAEVENGEELSRKEQCEEAIKAFECASKLFSETKKSVQGQLGNIEDNDEKQMATGIVKASGLRKEYCNARIALEEAKILDKKGDHFASSRKYGSAAETFEKMGETLESEQERKEFRSIISLSRAWQKMMLGDAKASPESYLEASALFEQASKESNTETAGFLALGHSRFCRALEAGTRFVDTKDQVLHAAFMENLENASNYYVRAGFRTASEYAKATRLLFDAYVHMDRAQKEGDPEKKAKLYTMADRILQTAAGSFMKAEHPEKREQVLRLLEKVKEEKELALSLSDVLHAPSVISATAAFTTPTPNQENAVGLERFEHADVQANLIIRQKELRIGENLGIELELVNAGKGSALLTKVTEIVPKGFEVAEKPETCRVEDSYINLKGKRLDPLKTEEVKLVLKPTLQGTFSLKPTVLYLDENGKYKSLEPEPVTITVKELGIKGWLKGER